MFTHIYSHEKSTSYYPIYMDIYSGTYEYFIGRVLKKCECLCDTYFVL